MDSEIFERKLAEIYLFTKNASNYDKSEDPLFAPLFTESKRSILKESNFWLTISSDERKKIIELLNDFIRKKELSKLQLFFDLIKYYKRIAGLTPTHLLLETKRINDGLINSKIFSNTREDICDQTYNGFLRALKNNTVYFVPVVINGEKKIFLGKTGAGDQIQNAMVWSKTRKQLFNQSLFGFNTLLLDPLTLDVYSFKNNKTRGLPAIKKRYTYKDIIFTPRGSTHIIREIKKEIPHYIFELKNNYKTHYEGRYKNNYPEKSKKIDKRINQIFSDKKIKSFSRAIGRSKSPVK
jgi:hypothetical protein